MTTAIRLSVVADRLEETEVLETHWLPFEQIMAMARSGELSDGKSWRLLRATTYVQPSTR